MKFLTHPSIAASATAGVALATATVVTDVPAWLWIAWGALTAIAVAQSIRSTT